MGLDDISDFGGSDWGYGVSFFILFYFFKSSLLWAVEARPHVGLYIVVRYPYGVSYLRLCVQWRILVLVRRMQGEEVPASGDWCR